MFRGLVSPTRAMVQLLVLLLAFGASVQIALHAGLDDDPFCERPAAAAEAGRTVSDATSPTSDQHCGVCHWLRSIRSFDAAPTGAAPVLIAAPDTVPHPAQVPAHVGSLSLVARAPPA